MKTSAVGNHGRRSNSKRKLFRGDRLKVVMESLIACFLLYIWISLFRFQYNALNINATIHNNSSSSSSSNSNNNNNSIQKRNNLKKIIPNEKRGDDRSKAYDSIFCRARSSSSSSSFRQNQNKNNADEIPSPNSNVKPVFLWGIPSTTSEFETGRRELLRKTYLNFFHQIESDETYQASKDNRTASSNSNTTTGFDENNKNIICSLHEWTCNAKIRAECQMIYVFFVGGHESINATTTTTKTITTTTTGRSTIEKQPLLPPTFLLNESITDFREMLLFPDTKKFDFSEPGTVYLDIRENQFDGKMTTWFKFASLLAREYNSEPTIARPGVSKTNIEYVFKVDSDLILLTPHFFRWFNGVHDEHKRSLPKSRNNNLRTPLTQRLYGGIEFPATNCVENFTFDHPCPLPLIGPSYMSGELNFMSVDLATYITSDDCPRNQWTIPHEDVSLSNYVYSYTNNTAYHERENNSNMNINTNSNSFNTNKNHLIHIVGINTSNVLLLPNMRANWETVSIRKNPDVLRTGELLWGHSIKRGDHKQYLYWKKDKKFARFWKLFYRIYTTTGSLITRTGGRRLKMPSTPRHEE